MLAELQAGRWWPQYFTHSLAAMNYSRYSPSRTCPCTNTQWANIWKPILHLIYMCMCREPKGHLQHLENRTLSKTLNVHSSKLPPCLCDLTHICTHFARPDTQWIPEHIQAICSISSIQRALSGCQQAVSVLGCQANSSASSQ